MDWGPEFFVLPNGAGVIRKDAKPCAGTRRGPCGNWDFAVVETAAGGVSVQCMRCVPQKQGDRILGVLDRRKWVFRRDDGHERNYR